MARRQARADARTRAGRSRRRDPCRHAGPRLAICAMICQIVSSSSWLDSTITVSGNPARSSSRAASTARKARSPESSRIPTGAWPRAPQPLERGDRVRHAAAQRVDGVDEQQRVVGVHVGVGVERGVLALAEGDEQLHHRVGVGAGRGQPELVADGAVRRRHRAADDRRPRRRVGALGGRPAHPELEHRPPVRRLDDASRLGGDERGEVELVEQRRLDQLGGRQVALDDRDRRVGWTTRPSGTASRRSPEKSSAAEPRRRTRRRTAARRAACGATAGASTSAGRARTDVIHAANGPRPAATQ